MGSMGLPLTRGGRLDGLQKGAVGLVDFLRSPVLLENEHGLSCTGACCSWMELAFSVGMYPFVWDLVYHYSLGPGVL